MKVFVIIPAAGLGTRMAGSGAKKKAAKNATVSKQFTEIGDAPILIHTLRKFAASYPVSDIYVAMRKNEMEGFRKQIKEEKLSKPVHVVEGGESRQESVANALAVLGKTKPSPNDVVLVHDAVRPFVDTEIINAVIEEASRVGAAIAGVPAVDTVKQVERTANGAIITSTVPRERVVMAQTPQGFRFSVIQKAFDDAIADGFIGTDEASLAERAGNEVAVVMGSARNIKITTPDDMELAEFLLSQDRRRSNLAG
jgi:2-C-methyl-D-erythritol 4-phosphate cytidylyltransferase